MNTVEKSIIVYSLFDLRMSIKKAIFYTMKLKLERN